MAISVDRAKRGEDASPIGKSAAISIPHLIVALVLSLGLSSALVVGRLYDETSFLSFSIENACALFLLAIALVVPLYSLLLRTTCDCRKAGQSASWLPSGRDRWLSIAAMSAPQLICWLIAWPGVYNHDAPFQILQLNASADSPVQLGNKYSVLYSLMLGGAVWLTRPFGIAEVGFAAVMLIQMGVIVYAQIKAVEYIGKTVRIKWAYWASVLFFALNPFGIVMRMSACQDAFFAAFLLLSIIEALRLGRKICSGTKIKPKEGARLVVFVVLMCLMRNNGIYLYSFALVCMLPSLLRKKQFGNLVLIVLPVVVSLIITGPVYKIGGVVDSGGAVREMLSVSSQQLARSYANNPDSFTDEDKKTLEWFYPSMAVDGCSWYWHEQEISDQAKARLRVEAVEEDIAGYIGFYIQIGMKNAGNYRDAFMMNTLGWWYPLKEYPDSRMYHDYVKYSTLQELDYDGELIEIKRLSLFPSIDKAIESAISSGGWSRVPVLNLLLNTGGYTWTLIILFAIAVLGKRKSTRFAFLIMAGLFLTYLLSPLCYFRYSYAMIICIPVLASVAFPIARDSIK